MPTILILNGPNLGRLGKREPHIYGSTTLAQLEAGLTELATELGVSIDFRQTNFEGEMVNWLLEAAEEGNPVVLNPAAWTHYSIAVRDAAAQRTADLIEVHISNNHVREEFRHTSYITPVATGTIVGLGVEGYALALRALATR
ncbi:type II 3-dehydroquinate dehydratase [Rhodococcus koreensis]